MKSICFLLSCKAHGTGFTPKLYELPIFPVSPVNWTAQSHNHDWATNCPEALEKKKKKKI
jgi:hypothetical protein